jgi:histidine triad (HIT) family protein
VNLQSEGKTKRCDFCAIARGADRSVEVVCEDTNWIAFFPLRPATPGHTLVIPRIHVRNLWEADDALGAELVAAVIRIGRAINAALEPEGINMITSAGEVAEQTVFHLHIHIVPRWRRDGFGDIWPAGKKFEDAKLENVAERIRNACANT